VLATGRRDPRIYAIDLKAALSPRNNGTANAIVSRSHTSPRHLDGRLLGDPANIVLSGDQRTAFVMNHHAAVDNAQFLQHGGRVLGSWPVQEGVAVAQGSDGKTYLVSGNGGTGGVWVTDLDKAPSGAPVVEVAPRIPVQSGPFGIKASPNGKFLAVMARESNR